MYVPTQHSSLAYPLDIAGRRQKFRLTSETLNYHVLKMEYAVRGRLPQEARKIEKAIQKAREREREREGGRRRERERERKREREESIYFLN